MKLLVDEATIVDVDHEKLKCFDHYEFPCGCKFKIDPSLPQIHGQHDAIIYDPEDINLECEATWDLISSGKTKGIFQLESSLGKHWAKRLKPRNMEHLSALMAVLRPGCMQSRNADGVSMTELYCRRKNGEEPVNIECEAISPILETTYNVLCYQEQSMKIAQVVAGFNLQEADQLRKAIGHKDTEIMSQTRKTFIEKAKEFGVVDEETAKAIFDNIQKSQRYAFNRCNSFDTKVLRQVEDGHLSNYTIEELYIVRNGFFGFTDEGLRSLYEKWDSDGHYGYGLSLDSAGRVKPNIIRDIQPAGLQDVVKITLVTGESIRVTANHKFPTPWGDREARHLIPRESLYVADASLPDHTEGSLSRLVRIASIEPDGECMTYDVTMDGPNHNFAVESGIITSNSHSVAYGLNSYRTAHWKTHFPLYFFTSYLYWAKDKQDPLKEIRQLINDAKYFGIEVLPPRFTQLRDHFGMDGIEITFGLADVKGIGEKAVQKLRTEASGLEPKIGKVLSWTWYDFLTQGSSVFGANVVRRMIEVGALRDLTTQHRQTMLAEFDAWDRLTAKEQESIQGLDKPILKSVPIKEKVEVEEPVYDKSELKAYKEKVKDDCEAIHPEPIGTKLVKRLSVVRHEEAVVDKGRTATNLADALETILERPGAVTTKRREKVESLLSLLRNPPASLVDTPGWIAKKEEESLGVPLSHSHTESADKSIVNCTIKDYNFGWSPKGRNDLTILGVQVQEVYERTVRNGDNRGRKMASLVVSDDTGVLEDVVVFPDAWEKHGHTLFRENTVVALGGKRTWKEGENTFIVEDVWDI